MDMETDSDRTIPSNTAPALLFPAEWQAIVTSFDSATAGSILLENGIIAHVSQSIARQLGFSETELAGRPVKTLLANGENSLYADGTRIGLASKSGDTIDFDLTINRIETLSDTRCSLWLLQRSDAASGKNMLCRNARPFQAIVENCPDAVCLCKPDSTLVYASPSFHSLLGYELDSLDGSRLADIVHADDRAEFLTMLKRLAQCSPAEDGRTFTCRARHRDGSWRHVCNHGRNLLNEPGVRSLLLTGRDVTDEQLRLQRLASERKRQLHYLNRLFQMAQRPKANVMPGLKVIVKAAAKALGAQRCAYWQVNADPAATQCMAMYDDVRQNFIDDTPDPALATLLHHVRLGEEAIVVPDVDCDPRGAIFCEYFHAALIKAVMLMPVRHGSQVVGILMLATLRQAREWSKDEAAFAGNVADLVSLTLQQAEHVRTEAQLRHLAHHDNLTGLPNRHFLFDQAADIFPEVTAASPTLAAFFIDLDGFKCVNDTLGHAMGDELLKAAALRLKNIVRTDDILVRLGGDEFMLLTRNLTDVRIAGDIAQQIVDIMRNTFVLHGHALQISASVGIAFYPFDGTDIDTLMKKADIAMYEAKSAGRDRYHLFTPALTEDVNKHPALETDLRKAIEAQELQHYYQPQIDLRTGQVCCVEAFLRWPHPRHGILLPGQFMSMAEKSGLIHDISEWALNDVCDRIIAWRALGLGDFHIAVNLSTGQLMDQDLLPALKQALDRNGVSGEQLEWEVQESAVMQHNTMIASMLDRAAAMRVGVTIDDFGTGYSSLSYLRRYPVHKVKIDGSFVRGLPDRSDDRAITDAIISMARPLGLDVVAEGVETPEQMEYLRDHGCRIGQGYYFTQPLTAEQFGKWLVRL
jgi:diguanylate cyclase (GGDEF)-like protein/PAS domain S-box-containing protein